MITKRPYFSPYFYNSSIDTYCNNINAYCNNLNKKENPIPDKKIEASFNNNLKNNSKKSKNKKSSLDSDFIFEFLGIKFYYDDILLIFLIYILYKENVKDNYLFIILFLLLIS